jgi:hypothetical protein
VQSEPHKSTLRATAEKMFASFVGRKTRGVSVIVNKDAITAM